MSRYVRKKFNVAELAEQTHDEARNRLLFDWWCDEGDLLGEADHEPIDLLPRTRLHALDVPLQSRLCRRRP